MFIAATPVGAVSNTFGFEASRLKKVFVNEWYKSFIKNDFPQPAFPVKNICKGSIFDGNGTDLSCGPTMNCVEKFPLIFVK